MHSLLFFLFARKANDLHLGGIIFNNKNLTPDVIYCRKSMREENQIVSILGWVQNINKSPLKLMDAPRIGILPNQNQINMVDMNLL